MRPFINRTIRSRVLIQSADSILLVKGWFSQGVWALPGGGVKKSESYSRGAKREVKEETGIDIDETELKFLGKFPHPGRDNYFKFQVAYFYVQVADDFHQIKSPSPWEIVDSQWFKLDKLPKSTGPITKQAVALCRKADLI